jgi:protein N-lysine methyltransferase METTL21A
MSVNDLIEAEIQDNLDPLRHLRVDDDAFIPTQPPSTHRQIQSQTFGDIQLDLLVDAGPGCGGIAWPAGQVLSNYLVHKGSLYLQDRRVLELGSGTGLVGLVAAKLGAPQVIITDQLSAQ